MNLQELEQKKKNYENVLARLQQAEGERKQILADKVIVQQELEKAGFKTKAELEQAKTVCEAEIKGLQDKLDKFVG